MKFIFLIIYNFLLIGSDTVYIILGSGVCGIIIGVIAVILTNFIIRRKKGDETVLKMSGLMNPNFKD